MKKIIIFLGLILIGIASHGQLLTPHGITITAPMKLGGVTITATGTELNYVHSVTSAIQTQFTGKVNVSDTATMLTHYAKTIATTTSLAAKVNLVPDTVQHTSSYTLQASDVSKEQMCLKTTSILITVPLNFTDMPIGSNLNFWGEGAGIMVFVKAGGVTFISPLDSIASFGKGDVIGLKKIAANKYWLYGNLTN
jgi:hypothetical protein